MVPPAASPGAVGATSPADYQQHWQQQQGEGAAVMEDGADYQRRRRRPSQPEYPVAAAALSVEAVVEEDHGAGGRRSISADQQATTPDLLVLKQQYMGAPSAHHQPVYIPPQQQYYPPGGRNYVGLPAAAAAGVVNADLYLNPQATSKSSIRNPSPTPTPTESSPFFIPSSQVWIDQSEEGLLGTGTYGIVRRAMLGSVPVVVKSLILKTLTRRVAEDFRREATVLSQLNHPRIVKFFGCIIEPNFSALVLELIHMGSLFDVYLTDAPPEDAVGPVKINMPSFPKRLQFPIDVAEGMQYLHTHKPKPIYHRDLKSMNVLVERDPQTQMLRGKLADFGLALIKTETLSTGLASAHLRDTGEPHFSRGPKGTMLWMAPELNDVHARFSPACDVFSFGVLLTEIASWAGPYTIVAAQLDFEKVKARLAQKRLPTLRYPDDVPETFKALVMGCLDMDHPERRKGFDVLWRELAEMQRAAMPQLAPPPTTTVSARPKSTRSNASLRSPQSVHSPQLPAVPSPTVHAQMYDPPGGRLQPIETRHPGPNPHGVRQPSPPRTGQMGFEDKAEGPAKCGCVIL